MHGSGVTMRGRLAIAGKAIGATLLALAVGVFIWDYIAVHPWAPKLWYRVDVPSGGYGAAMVSVGGPDTQTSFDGKDGYAWEMRPISISGKQAVVDFRVKHFNYSAPHPDMLAELAESRFHRLILRPEQTLTVEAPDGAKVSLSSTIQ